MSEMYDVCASPDIYPDWRYRRAMGFVESNLTPTYSEDKYVRKAFMFFRRQKCLTEELDKPCDPEDKAEKQRRKARHIQRIKLYGVNKALYAAQCIYTATNRFKRDALEALLVAGASVEAIATNSDMTPDVIEWYERLYFDIRSKLNKPLAVLGATMSRGLTTGFDVADREQLWKYIGYTNGPGFLSAFWSSFKLTDDQQRQFKEFINSQRLRQTAIASVVMSPNNFNSTDLLRLNHETEVNTGDKNVTEVEESAAAALISAIKVSVKSVEQVSESVVEARASEPILKAIAAGIVNGDADLAVRPENVPETKEERIAKINALGSIRAKLAKK